MTSVPIVRQSSPSSTDPLLVVILGPTASGKTALSLALAQRFHGEIVNCDSVAVYREMEIGTAKPTPAERALVPHHMIDVVAPDGACTAGDYCRSARASIADVSSRGALPIVTGGTGLYLRALIDGLFAGPQRSEGMRERLRRSQQRHPAGWLARVLARIDPQSAVRIHANDTPKLIRAIEVSIAGRRPMSDAWQTGRDPLRGYRILRLGLDPDRNSLYARINARASAMFDEGLVEETRDLVARYGDHCRPLDSLGYRQARSVLSGILTREAAIDAARQGHRNFAKRQLTWFRREPEVIWLHGFGDDPAIQADAVATVSGMPALTAPNSPPNVSLAPNT
jgi:tRNA dimethylallyltransferase